MNNLTAQAPHTEAIQEFGRVTARDGETFFVATGSGTYPVRRAVSCLVEPELADRVLCAFGADGSGYMLAVLEKHPDAQPGTVLCFEEDARICTPSGRLDISARDGVEIGGGKEVRVASGRLDLTAGEAEVRLGGLSFWSEAVEAGAGALRVTADRLESCIGRAVQFVKNSFRHVEETDHLACGRLHYKAEKSLQLRGEFTQMTAEGDVHIDGERINIG